MTLSGFAGGECFPLPASKGLAFPFLLTLDGCPISPGICAQEQWCSPKKSRNSKKLALERPKGTRNNVL